MLSSMFDLIGAIFGGDIWLLKSQIQGPGIWPLSLILMLAFAYILLIVYRKFPFIERHFERTVMVFTYLTIGIIIFVEVFRRFVIGEQVPWSTTLPPFLFLVMTWFGCSYNVKLRTHLAFAEFRAKSPRSIQFGLLCLDAVLWTVFSWIVVTTSMRVVVNSISNFQILLGTDNVMQWWFLISVPLAFIFLVTRVMENLSTDIQNYRSGEPLIKAAVIGDDS